MSETDKPDTGEDQTPETAGAEDTAESSAEPASDAEAAPEAEAIPEPAAEVAKARAEPTLPPPGEEAPIEELSPHEEATTLQEVMELVKSRKQSLDQMPDGPRPRTGEPYKRRKMLVDWHLQVNYIGVYLATVTLLVVGFLALNYVFTALYRQALRIQEHQPFGDDTNLVMLAILNGVFVLLLVIGMAVYAIIQSHRVAGPVLRFRRALHAIHRRDYDFYLQLRQRDYMHDLAQQLNLLNNSLKAKDIVVSDAVMTLDTLSKRGSSAEELQEVAANLCDVVLPIPVEDGADPGKI